jgi:glycerol-3-phosphate responsive antiterminator
MFCYSLSFVYRETAPVVPKIYILDSLAPHDTARFYQDPAPDNAEIMPTLDVKTLSPQAQSADGKLILLG